MNGKGLEGLGIINTNNASATIENVGIPIVQKEVLDGRKIQNINDNLKTSKNMYLYLKNWFSNSRIFEVSDVQDDVKQILGFSDIFYARFTKEIISTSCEKVFCILCTPSLENVKSIIELLSKTNSAITNMHKIGIGYYECDKSTRIEAQNVGLELVGAEDIRDINSAIDKADNKIPYFNINMKSFSSMLAKALNEKYSSQAVGFLQKEQNALSSELTSIGASLKGAFTDGLNQLSHSFSSLTDRTSCAGGYAGVNGPTVNGGYAGASGIGVNETTVGGYGGPCGTNGGPTVNGGYASVNGTASTVSGGYASASGVEASGGYVGVGGHVDASGASDVDVSAVGVVGTNGGYASASEIGTSAVDGTNGVGVSDVGTNGVTLKKN